MVVVDPVPVARRGVRTMAPVKRPTQSRKVAPKGKAVPHPTTRLCARKFTRIATPMPEVTDIAAPLPPIASPSRASRAPLFEEAAGSGDEQVRRGAPASSGKCSLGLSLRFTDHGHHSFWYAHPVEVQGRRGPSRCSSPPLPAFPSPSALSAPSPSQTPLSRSGTRGSDAQLLRTGAWRMDTLRVAQMAAQEASVVMAAAMLRQQGVMREVSVWESEVEGTMRERSEERRVGK